MSTVGDRRQNAQYPDRSKLARGIVPTARFSDMETRRWANATNQNIEYLLRKVIKIPEPKPEDKPEDITKRPRKKVRTMLPEAVMISATWDDSYGAAFVGAVNPKGQSTAYLFEYMYVEYDETSDTFPPADFTNANTIQTTQADAGSGDIAASVTDSVTGLHLVKRYYVRIKAWNETGTVWSNVVLFDTCKNPEVTVDYASKVTTETAHLTGTVDPNGIETTYWFVYGETPQLMTNETAKLSAGDGSSPVAVEADLAGLKHNTIYFFSLYAENACGLTDNTGEGLTGKAQYCTGSFRSDVMMFKTLEEYAPVVSNSGASDITETTAILTGTINPKGLASIWAFPYGTAHAVQEFGEISVDTIIPPKITPTDSAGDGESAVPIEVVCSGLTPNTQYYCQVIGTNSQGTAFSDIWGFTTLQPELTISGDLDFGAWLYGDTGSSVKTVTIENTGDTGSTLNWTAGIEFSEGFAGTVTFSKTSGTLLGGASEDITITITKDTVNTGEFTGTFTATATWCENETLPAEVNVYTPYTGNLPVAWTLTNTDGFSGSYNGNIALVNGSGGAYLSGYLTTILKLSAEEEGIPAGTWVVRCADAAMWNITGKALNAITFVTGGLPNGGFSGTHGEDVSPPPHYVETTITITF